MKNTPPDVASLYELYRTLELPVDFIRASGGLTIHNLKEVGFALPYQSPSFRPDYFSFLFIKDGLGQYTIDQQIFDVIPHSIYFTNPGNFRTFSWQKIEEIYLVTFNETFLKQYISKDIFQDFPFLLTETIQPKIATAGFYKSVEDIYLQIHQEYLSSSSEKNKIIGHLLAVLLYRIKSYFWEDYNPLREGTRGSQIVKNFKQLLEKHYRELRSGKAEKLFRTGDYARAQNLHPNYLNNVIKTKTGKSVTEWITGKTMQEACRLLQNMSVPVKEISYKLGFSETAHFSHFFKKNTGFSPARYRKQALL